METAVLIGEDGKIAALAAPGLLEAQGVTQVIDAAGLLVLPGGVDIHVHVQDGAETFFHGTSAAAAGGLTTVVDIAGFHVCSTAAGLRERARLGERECVTDFGLYGGIAVDSGDLAELQQVADLGAPFFKVFMPSEPPVETAFLWACVQAAARTGLRLALHAEEVKCLAPEVNWADPLGFPKSRPAVAETSATAQALEMARAVGAPIHICHVSVGRTADLVADYRSKGTDVTAETAPHFLLFDESEFVRQGARVKTTPPLRTRDDAETLWQALRQGVIDALACDHYLGELPAPGAAPVGMKQKEAGIAGLELSLPLLFDAGVHGQRMDFRRFVEVTSERPAALAGLARTKGKIAVGADADLTLFNPDETWEIGNLFPGSRVYTTPYVGRTIRGRVKRTLVRGKTVFDGERITAEPGWGRYQAHQRANKEI